MKIKELVEEQNTSTTSSLDEEVETIFVKAPYTEHIEQHPITTADLLRSRISSLELQQKLGFADVDSRFDAEGDSAPTADDVEFNKLTIDEVPTIYQNRIDDEEEKDNSLSGILEEFEELNKPVEPNESK